MTPEERKKLEQAVDYINMEHMLDDRQAMLFMNPQDAIDAIRRNEIPGIFWTAEDEIKYQRDLLTEANPDLSGSTKVLFIVKYHKDGYLYTAQLYLEPKNVFQQLRVDFGIDMSMISSIQQVS